MGYLDQSELTREAWTNHSSEFFGHLVYLDHDESSEFFKQLDYLDQSERSVL